MVNNMSTHIEIEFKTLLTKSEYERVQEYFNLKEIEPKKQTNVYFDTDDYFLKQRHIIVRTRLKDEIIEFTIKMKGKKGNIEINQPISEQDFQNLVNNSIIPNGVVKVALNELNITTIKVKAELTTYRYEVNYHNCLIALDESYYGDKIDYELELEVPEYDYGQKVFRELLEMFSLPHRLAKPKAVRAIEYSQQKNPG